MSNIPSDFNINRLNQTEKAATSPKVSAQKIQTSNRSGRSYTTAPVSPGKANDVSKVLQNLKTYAQRLSSEQLTSKIRLLDTRLGSAKGKDAEILVKGKEIYQRALAQKMTPKNQSKSEVEQETEDSQMEKLQKAMNRGFQRKVDFEEKRLQRGRSKTEPTPSKRPTAGRARSASAPAAPSKTKTEYITQEIANSEETFRTSANTLFNKLSQLEKPGKSIKKLTATWKKHQPTFNEFSRRTSLIEFDPHLTPRQKSEMLLKLYESPLFKKYSNAMKEMAKASAPFKSNPKMMKKFDKKIEEMVKNKILTENEASQMRNEYNPIIFIQRMPKHPLLIAELSKANPDLSSEDALNSATEAALQINEAIR